MMSLMRRATPNYDGVRVLWDNRNVRTERVSFGQVRYQPGGYCGPRIQRDYELVVIHSGECRVRVDSARMNLRIGFAYLFCPGHREHFQFSQTTETHHSWCSITPKFFSAALRRELETAPATGVACSETFQRILSAAFLSRPSSTRVIEALGMALFAEFLDAARQTHGLEHSDECVQRALRVMEDHFGEEDCLAVARGAAGCSVNTLIYKFRRQTGLSPARYLWKLRVEKGMAMLAETGLTVAEIAYRCGFKNPFHFSRLVRQHHGCSPRELRRRAWA